MVELSYGTKPDLISKYASMRPQPHRSNSRPRCRPIIPVPPIVGDLGLMCSCAYSFFDLDFLSKCWKTTSDFYIFSITFSKKFLFEARPLKRNRARGKTSRIEKRRRFSFERHNTYFLMIPKKIIFTYQQKLPTSKGRFSTVIES